MGKGELPPKEKKKKKEIIIEYKDDAEKERAINIAEKWIERGYITVTIGGIMRLLRLGYDEFRIETLVEIKTFDR